MAAAAFAPQKKERQKGNVIPSENLLLAMGAF